MPIEPQISEYGTVVAVNHSIVTVTGLPTIKPGEVVTFEDGSMGQVFSFEVEETLVLAFSNTPLTVGCRVERTKQPISFYIPDRILGKVISPLGEVLFGPDGQKRSTQLLIDKAPPPLTQRAQITETLRTGTTVVDLLLPLAKGQREMIAGDKKTGKTDFSLRLLRNQALEGNIVIYAAIAKKKDDIVKLYNYFDKYQILDKLVLVASFSSDSPSLINLTPFSAMSIAEYFRDQGQDTVMILDDLLSHAQVYRELSLLSKRFPGRDSYPGDIFYLHARLLERAGTFVHPQDPQKTVSITCLPMAETMENDLTSYIVSNLISITDGHLLFDYDLFQQGQRPAVHHSLSVTRVGKQTQSSLERNITKELTSFFTVYEKTLNMTHFSAELTDSSRRTLRIGNQLKSLFVETNDLIIPKTVQKIMVALIWHGWLSNVQSKSLQIYRDNIASKYYQDEKTRSDLDELIQVKEFVQLLETTKGKQQWLINLCQV